MYLYNYFNFIYYLLNTINYLKICRNIILCNINTRKYMYGTLFYVNLNNINS